MRLAPLALIIVTAGCAGQLRDYVGPRSSILSPQLIRYGLDLDQARCVGGQLGALRTPLLRRLARSAGALRQGYYEPGRLTMRDFAWVATATGGVTARTALDRASAACSVAIMTREAPPPVAVPTPAVPRPPVWLNLGAAGSGQSIAINASTIEQEGPQRSAWFRLTDPGASAPSADTFLLHIDCTLRTINAKTRRRLDPAGAVADNVDYPDNPLPVEGGTVMEIAFLSLCT